MRVPRQILQHHLGAAERLLGVHHPIRPDRLRYQPLELLPPGQRLRLAREPEPPGGESGAEASQELAPKHPAQHPDRQEKVGTAADPAGAIRRRATAWHHAMDMGMQLQVLAPGVQHRQHADLGAQMLRIGGDLDQGLGGGPHQQTVDFTRVGQRDRVQRPRERENDVEVGHLQKVGRLRLQPTRRRGAVALRAVAVAAGIVADLLIPALRTSQDMPAQRRRAAGRQVVQGSPLFGC